MFSFLKEKSLQRTFLGKTSGIREGNWEGNWEGTEEKELEKHNIFDHTRERELEKHGIFNRARERELEKHGIFNHAQEREQQQQEEEQQQEQQEQEQEQKQVGRTNQMWNRKTHLRNIFQYIIIKNNPKVSFVKIFIMSLSWPIQNVQCTSVT